MLAKAIRTFHDPTLVTWMRTQIQNILESDQICYQDDPLAQNEYKSKLALKQAKEYKPLFDFMSERFEINLKTWHHMPLDSQDASVAKITPILESMDPYVLNSVHQVC